jgi:hypothetical protein
MRLRILVTFLLTLSALGVFVTSAGAATRFVAPDGNDGSGKVANDCLSVGNPCQTVQSAIEKAEAGDTVSAAAGTYMEEVQVNKALTVVGQGPATVLEDATAEPVVRVKADLALEDLRIRSGQSGSATGPAVLANKNDTELTLDGVTAEQPPAATDGVGTVRVFGSEDTLIVKGSTVTGVAEATLVIDVGDAAIIGSTVTAAPSIRTGAVAALGGSVSLIGSSVTDSGVEGPALLSEGARVDASGSTLAGPNGVWASKGSTTLIGDTIAANKVGLLLQEGATVGVRDSLIAPFPGGTLPVGILVNPSAVPAALTIVGSTLYAEEVGDALSNPIAVEVGAQEGDVEGRIANSILRAVEFGNLNQAFDIESGAAGATWSITHSDFTTVGFGFDIPEPGAGTNVAAIPVFAGQASGDYRLTEADTPLLDAGDPAEVTPGETDLAGQPREVDGNCDGVAATDIGAFELNPSASCPSPPSGEGVEGVGGVGGAGQSPQSPAGDSGSHRPTRPSITGIKVKRLSKGPMLGFTLNESAKVKVTIVRVTSRKVGNRNKTIYEPVATITDEVGKGVQSIPLATRIDSAKLKPGTYRLTVVASAKGLISTMRRLSMTISRG